ncbi:MAG: hypothetical protein DLM57_17705 [Pseudonocardiales bacterium]|nr:MAG: hypothetical protein DLM57_17705 [Pseudonocardiales bacterium]
MLDSTPSGRHAEQGLDLRPGLVVRIEHDARRAQANPVVLVVEGELDLATVELLRAVFDGLIREGRTVLRVNLAGLSFCDALGVGVLIGAQQRVARSGGSLSVSDAHGIVLRVLTLTGGLDQLTEPPAQQAPAAHDRERLVPFQSRHSCSRGDETMQPRPRVAVAGATLRGKLEPVPPTPVPSALCSGGDWHQ